MIRHLVTLLLVLLVSTAGSVSYTLDVQDVTKRGDFNGGPKYFRINTRVELQDELWPAAGSVIEFGPEGRLVGNGTAKIYLEGVYVKAWDVCIFENVRVGGKPTNARVPAAWFGQSGMSDAQTINRALGSVPGNAVALTRRQYVIDDTIKMTQKGQRIEGDGKLIVRQKETKSGRRSTSKTEIPAIEISNLFVGVKLGAIEGEIWNQGRDNYRCTGILIDGNSYNTNIDVVRYNYLRDAFGAIPRKIGTSDYSGSQYVKVDFMSINAINGIHIDLLKNATKTFETWFNEVQFSGGTVTAKNGVLVENEPYNPEHKVDLIGGNIYRNITFMMTDCDAAIRYFRTQKDYFRNISFRGQPRNGALYADFEKGSDVVLTSTSNVPYTRIGTRRDNFNVIIDARITDDGINTQLGTDRVVMFPDSSWGNGATTRFVTSRIVPYNLINQIEVTEKNTVLTPRDLLDTHLITSEAVPAPPFQSKISIDNLAHAKYLNRLCKIIIKGNFSAYLDVADMQGVPNIPIDIIVDKQDGSILPSNSLNPIEPGDITTRIYLTPGVYRLTRDVNRKPILVRLGN